MSRYANKDKDVVSFIVEKMAQIMMRGYSIPNWLSVEMTS